MGRPSRSDSVEIDAVGWKADLLAKLLSIVCAVSFSVSMLFVLAVTDPATVDLFGRFEPHVCVTARSLRTKGATVCENWSSCKKLCADPPVLYSCVHIHVYVLTRVSTPMRLGRSVNYTQTNINQSESTMSSNLIIPTISIFTENVDFNVSQSILLQNMELNSSTTIFTDSGTTDDIDVLETSVSQNIESSSLTNMESKETTIKLADSVYETNVSLIMIENSLTSLAAQLVNVTKFPVRLYVNAPGCGYEVNCSQFFEMYGEIGLEFACLYSKHLNKTIPVDGRSAQDPLGPLLMPLAPLLVSALSLLYLCVRGHCHFPRIIPKSTVIKMIKKRRRQVVKQLRFMQRQSIHSVAKSTPSRGWQRVPLPSITLERAKRPEDDLVLSAV